MGPPDLNPDCSPMQSRKVSDVSTARGVETSRYRLEKLQYSARTQIFNADNLLSTLKGMSAE